MSAGKIIDELGGTTAVAKGIGVDAPVVSNWRARGYIPPGKWAAVVDLAKASKVPSVTFERLAELQQAPAA